MDTAEFRKPRPDFPIVPQSAIYRQGELVPFRVPKGRRGKKPKGKRGSSKGAVPLPIRKPPKQRKLEEAKIEQIRENIKFQRETLQLQKDIADETIRYRTGKQERERQQQAVRQIENRLVQRRHDRLIEDQAQVFQTLLDRQRQDTQSQFERAERREGRLQDDYKTFMREVLQSRGLPQEEEEIDIRFFEEEPIPETEFGGGFSSAMGQELGRPDESMGARLRRQQQEEQQVPLTEAEQQEVRFKIYQGITQPSPTSAEVRQLRTLETAEGLLEASPLSPRSGTRVSPKTPADILREAQQSEQSRLQEVQRHDELERRARRERFEETAEAGLRLSPVGGATLQTPPETPRPEGTLLYTRSGLFEPTPGATDDEAREQQRRFEAQFPQGEAGTPARGGLPLAQIQLPQAEAQTRARGVLLRRGGSARATEQLQAQLSEPPAEAVELRETLAHSEDVAFEQQIEPALAEQLTEPLDAGQEEELSPATDVFIPQPTPELERRLQQRAEDRRKVETLLKTAGRGLVEEDFDEPQPEPAPKRLPTPSPRPAPRPEPEPEPEPPKTEAQQFFEQQVKTEPRTARFSGIRPELLLKGGRGNVFQGGRLFTAEDKRRGAEESEADLFTLLDQQFTEDDTPQLRKQIYLASKRHLDNIGVVKTNVTNYKALTELLNEGTSTNTPTGKGALYLEMKEPLLRTSKAQVEKFAGIYKIRQLPAKQGTGKGHQQRLILQNVLGEGEPDADIGHLNIFKKGTKATGGINPFQKALDEGKVIVHQDK
jgi:hypothetical protein